MLTELAIKAFKPKDKPYKKSDYNGLYLCITPTGSKIFRYDYKFNGKRNTFTLGRYPVVTLKDARGKVESVKELLSKGIDPNSNKKIVSSPHKKFKNVALEWVKKNEQTLSEPYARGKLLVLEKNVFSHLGERSIDDIKPMDILDMIRIIENRGALSIARKTLQIVSEIYAYAIATGKASINATIGLNKALIKQPPHKHRATITDPLKISILMQKIFDYDEWVLGATALKVLAYTMLRPNEVMSAKWKYIDFKKMIWKIPASEMKSNRTHIIPLSKQVADLLLSVPKTSDYIFWSDTSEKGYMNPVAFNRILRDRLGYKANEITAHGFRSMASTILYENGYLSDIVEMQLAHVDKNKVRSAYNHALYLDKRKEMLQWYADYLDTLRLKA